MTKYGNHCYIPSDEFINVSENRPRESSIFIREVFKLLIELIPLHKNLFKSMQKTNLLEILFYRVS